MTKGYKGYEPPKSGTFLDLNGTAVGDIQKLGKFLREEFEDYTPEGVKTSPVDPVEEAMERLRELNQMRYYKAIVDELDEETLAKAALQAKKRGVIKRLQPREHKAAFDQQLKGLFDMFEGLIS